jgi:hypothetical protein
MANTINSSATTTTVTTTVIIEGLSESSSEGEFEVLSGFAPSRLIDTGILSDDDGLVDIILSSDKESYKTNNDFTIDIILSPEYGMEIAGIQFDVIIDVTALYIELVNEGNYFRQGVNIVDFAYGYKDINTLKIMAYMGSPDFIYNNNAGIVVQLKCTALNNFTLSKAVSLSNIIIGNKDGVALPYEVN